MCVKFDRERGLSTGEKNGSNTNASSSASAYDINAAVRRAQQRDLSEVSVVGSTNAVQLIDSNSASTSSTRPFSGHVYQTDPASLLQKKNPRLVVA